MAVARAPGPSTGSLVSSGLLLFIRYAFMPNHLGYCGGNENELLLERAATGKPDPRLTPLLTKFTGALPYLRSIAAANGIGDPFDARVVEAYWVGNDLLAGVEAGDLYKTLEDRFGPDLPRQLREQVLRKPPQGAKPFHLFHVVDVYRHLERETVGMAAMDSCRISWGRVRTVEDASLVVDRQPLVMREGRLALGEAQPERVLRSLDGLGFATDVGVGDWVSIHWGWACEVLDQRRLANLRRWSSVHLTLANQTI
jgi:hydrogenase maturation factor